MKANELMIGDLINAFGVVRRVTDIYGLDRPEDDGLLTTMVPGCEFPKSNLSFRPCYARPIPLTGEIFEKNGFISDEYSPYYLPINEGSVRFSEHQYGWYCNILCAYQKYDGVCNYVHQLQHALRLCNIEKEIKL